MYIFICGSLIGTMFGMFLSAFIVISDQRTKIHPVLNNSIVKMEQLKRDCEKDLPRSEECVMVFDFVPVKKEKSE